MAWIKTIAMNEADDRLKDAIRGQRSLYPPEYDLAGGDENTASGIVASHSLIPDVLFHAFATYGSVLSPDLPLARRQHEMIATVVSAQNQCVY